MADQLWTAHALISSSLVLVKSEQLAYAAKPHPNFRSIIFTPQINDKGQQTGQFQIEIEFVIEDTGDKSSSCRLAADIGREILDHYLGLLTFLFDHQIKLTKPPSFNYQYPDTSNGVTGINVICGVHMEAPPPMKLDPSSLLRFPIKTEYIRILSYFRQATNSTDIADSVLMFLIALEILANQFDTNEQRIVRKCPNCGHETRTKFGAAQKIKHLLVNVLAFKDKDFEEIWDARNALMHGGLSFSAKALHQLHGVKARVRLAITRGMKQLLGLKPSDLPLEAVRIEINDPMLILTLGKKPPSQ
jgi:hypothetical protein